MRSVRGAGCLAALLTWSACAPVPTPDEQSTAGGTALIHVAAAPDSWNPYTARNATSTDILSLLYPTLAEEIVDENGHRFAPSLAGSWQFDDTGTALTFELDPDARWSDGSAVTCADVAFTLQAQQSEEVGWPGRDSKKEIDRVDCPSEHRAVFVFHRAYADALLDAVDKPIVPRHLADVPFSAWKSTDWLERLTSAGPFRLAEVVADQRIALVRDTAYWGDPALLDAVTLLIHPDADAAAALLLNGEIDMMPNVPAGKHGAVAESVETIAIEIPSRSYLFIGWNQLEPDSYVKDRRSRGCAESACEETAEDIRDLLAQASHPVLTDPDVRHALTLAIDRRGLLDALWSGRGRVPDVPLPADSWVVAGDAQLGFDPNEARRILDGAGWIAAEPGKIRQRQGRPLQLDMIVYAGNARMVEVAEMVRGHLGEVGVDLTIVRLSRAEFVRRAWDKQFDAVLSAWRMGTRIEPGLLFGSSSAADRGNNLIAWSRPRWDALFERAALASTRRDAGELWATWQRWFVQDLPYTILVEPARVVGVSRRLQGVSPTALAPYRAVETWHLERPPSAP